MRGLLVVFVAGLSAAFAAAGDKELHVSKFPEGRFLVLLPEDPVVDDKLAPSDAGQLLVATVRGSVNSKFVVAVTYTDYPAKLGKLDAEKVLAAARDGIAGKTGKVIDEKAVKANDPNPAGVEVRLDCGKTQARVRLFLVGSRLYQVTAAGSEKDVDGETAKRFLASFQVMEGKK